MTYKMAPFPMTLSDLYRHLPIASLFECDLWYSCVAADKISTDLERRAVPLRRLSLLFTRSVQRRT